MYFFKKSFVFTKHFVFLQKQVTKYKNSTKIILPMAIRLTEEAKEKLLNDNKLYVQITEMLEIKITSLYPLLKRNSPIFARYDVAKTIATAMGKTVDDILETEEIRAVAV